MTYPTSAELDNAVPPDGTPNRTQLNSALKKLLSIPTDELATKPSGSVGIYYLTYNGTERTWLPIMEASSTMVGFMSATDKAKLDAIESGANKTEFGTTAGKALPGDWRPSWGDVSGKPDLASATHTHTTTALEVSADVKTLLDSPNLASIKSTLGVPSSSAIATAYTAGGVVSGLKMWIGTATAGSNGGWEVDYSSAGFTQVFGVFPAAIGRGLELADRLIAANSVEPPTLTKAKGNLMTSSGAGLLVAVTLTATAGTVNVLVIGR